MKIWVAPPGRLPRPAEVLAKSDGNLDWETEKGDYAAPHCCHLLKLDLFPAISIPVWFQAKVGQRETCEIWNAKAAAVTLLKFP